MHWIEGSGKVLSAVATLNGVAEGRRRSSFDVIRLVAFGRLGSLDTFSHAFSLLALSAPVSYDRIVALIGCTVLETARRRRRLWTSA